MPEVGNHYAMTSQPRLRPVSFPNAYASSTIPQPGQGEGLWQQKQEAITHARDLEAWPESHRPGFALRQADVLQSYTA